MGQGQTVAVLVAEGIVVENQGWRKRVFDSYRNLGFAEQVKQEG